MKAVIYYTEIPEKYTHRNMEHMLGEKLLETGVKQEYGMNLSYEPRAVGEHGKPFLPCGRRSITTSVIQGNISYAY